MDEFDSEKLDQVTSFLRARVAADPGAPAPHVDALSRVIDFADETLSAHLRVAQENPAVGRRLLETLGAPLWDTLVRISLAWRDDSDYPIHAALFAWELSHARTLEEAMAAGRRHYLGPFPGLQ